MAASTNSVSLTINEQDASGVNVILRQVGAVSYAGSVGQNWIGTLTSTGATSLTLPITNVLQWYFKNTHATALITLTATKQGGTGAIVAVKGPGGIFLNWDVVSGAVEGYTAISLTSDTVGATFETYIGG